MTLRVPLVRIGRSVVNLSQIRYVAPPKPAKDNDKWDVVITWVDTKTYTFTRGTQEEAQEIVDQIIVAAEIEVITEWS